MTTLIGVIPGAGYDKLAYWPLSCAGLLPLSYRRKKDVRHNQEVLQHKRTIKDQYGIKRYARRVLHQLKNYDTEVDLLCHSMGWVIAQPLLDMIAEEKLDGLVRNVIGLTPAIAGGPPVRNFYFSPHYLGKRSAERVGRERPEYTQAVTIIRQVQPDFNPMCTGEEVFRALLQSVQGVIADSVSFPKERMFVFYSEQDHIIPADVTRHMLARSGVSNECFNGFGGHSAPIVDLEGELLKHIKTKFRALNQTQPGIAAE